MTRSATLTSQAMPPAASIAAAALITARMMSMTSMGGAEGFSRKITVRMRTPTPPQRPSAMPPLRAPRAMTPSTTTSSMVNFQSMR